MTILQKSNSEGVDWTDYPEEVVPIDRIRPNPKNPWQHSERQKEAVDGSLSRFGLLSLPVWNKRTQNLVDGHLRWELAVVQGTEALRCRVVDWSEEEEKAAIASINRTGLLVERDDEQLAALLRDISDREGELPPGWGEEDLAELLAGLSESRGGMKEGADPDAIPSSVQTRCQPGDLWVLGNHRLLCGDSTVATDVERLFGDAEPSLMVTDPPYGVEYDPTWRNEAAEKGLISFAASRKGKVQNDDRVDWYEAWTLFPGDVVYCWHAGRHASTVQQGLEQAGFEVRCQIIWAKPRFVISRGHYHWQHEPCWYAVKNNATAGWCGDRSQTTLWEIPLTTDDQKTDHGTQKPVECMSRAIRNHEGDVYDPFLGSGTTLIAAESLGRRCFGIDIDPTYCDLAIARWETATGRDAQLLVRHG